MSICVRVQFRETRDAGLDSGHDLADVGPSAATCIPTDAIQVVDVYPSRVFSGNLVHWISNEFASRNRAISHRFQFIEVGSAFWTHSIFLLGFTPSTGGRLTSSVSIGWVNKEVLVFRVLGEFGFSDCCRKIEFMFFP